MSNRNVIVFLSAYSYLSNPHFFSVAPKLNEYTTIFLDVKDPVSTAFNKAYYQNKELILSYFDIFHELEELPFDIGKSITKWEKIKKFKVFKKYKEMIETYLNKINPYAVVSCSDLNTSDMIASHWCKKRNRPFIILQPAIVFDKRKKNYGIKHKIKYLVVNRLLGIPKYKKQPIFGNEATWGYLFLWGEEFVLNANRGNTYFVGNPAYDDLFNAFAEDRTIKNNILICTDHLAEISSTLNQKVIKMYIEAIKARTNLNFYLKVHPREPLEDYERIFNKKEYSNVKIVRDYDLIELYNICDVLISVNSTVLLDAAAMGLPIITLNPNNEFKFVDHFREKVNIKVIKAENLAKAIDLALSDDYWKIFLERREKYFNQRFSSSDGQSGERVAKKIKELILQCEIKG